MEKYKYLIQPGIEQSLNAVAFHHTAPFVRHVMLEKKRIEGDGGVKIVTHIINGLPKIIEPYCDLHRHDFDEINLILSADEKLVYKIQFEDETYEVQSPATVYVPRGMRHAAEVISGKGLFVTILFTKNYQAKK
jgi:hypothetical protein